MELVTLSSRKDRAPWVLLPCIVFVLSSVTLLAPRHAAQAAPPAPSAAKSPMADYDDGDGDELLEHWGDPKYAREQRLQCVGMAGGFILLGIFAYRKRTRSPSLPQTQALRKAA